MEGETGRGLGILVRGLRTPTPQTSASAFQRQKDTTLLYKLLLARVMSLLISAVVLLHYQGVSVLAFPFGLFAILDWLVITVPYVCHVSCSVLPTLCFDFNFVWVIPPQSEQNDVYSHMGQSPTLGCLTSKASCTPNKSKHSLPSPSDASMVCRYFFYRKS